MFFGSTNFRMTDEISSRVCRLKWNPQDMERAMEAVKRGISVSGAARQFQVPRKTLDDRVKGCVQHGAKPGPSTALTVEEEGALASYLLYMAERGLISTDHQHGSSICMGCFS